MCNNHKPGQGHDEHNAPEQKSIRVLFEAYPEKGMNDVIKNELDQIRALPQTEPQEVITRLEQLVEKYPSVASLRSSLGYMYELNKELEKAEQCFKEAVTLFPEDVVIKSAYAGYFLRRGNFEKVAEIFNNIFDIRQAYPERDNFYALEVLEFYGTVGLYHAAVGNKEDAHNCLTIVKRIDPKSSYALSIGDMLGFPREDDPHYAKFYKLLKKERNKVRMQ